MPFASLLRSIGIVVVAVLLIIAANLCFYTVSETEQVIITQFGKTVGQPINEAGMKFKWPFIQTVNRIDKRILEWDGRASEMPTRDKLYIVVDTFGRWRISDPLQYYTRLRDERSALSRLDDIIGSEVRNAIAKHDLIEIVRTDKNRKASEDAAPVADASQINRLLPITLGRTAIEKEVVAESAPKLRDFGVELIDVRFMRVNYNAGVSAKIHERMVSERQQIASRFRSEGEGEAAARSATCARSNPSPTAKCRRSRATPTRKPPRSTPAPTAAAPRRRSFISSSARWRLIARPSTRTRRSSSRLTAICSATSSNHRGQQSPRANPRILQKGSAYLALSAKHRARDLCSPRLDKLGGRSRGRADMTDRLTGSAEFCG
jgi:modulator of FtsH protease HflC